MALHHPRTSKRLILQYNNPLHDNEESRRKTSPTQINCPALVVHREEAVPVDEDESQSISDGANIFIDVSSHQTDIRRQPTGDSPASATSRSLRQTANLLKAYGHQSPSS
jgi:hypothetical protein